MYNEIQQKLKENLNSDGNMTFLVGAGLSAESGIPTFRDIDGYWTQGSSNYTPEDLATYRMFTIEPELVWAWYIHRFRVCHSVSPNKGHYYIKTIQELIPDKFSLISQNVDGLHHRTGMDDKSLFLIHGNINKMRCSHSCTNDIYDIPKYFLEHETENILNANEMKHLSCPKCNKLCRPHILWFDECYNEEFYKYESAKRVSKNTNTLIIIGTYGSMNLPNQIFSEVKDNYGLIIDINPNENLFTNTINSYKNGYWIRESSIIGLEKLVELVS